MIATLDPREIIDSSWSFPIWLECLAAFALFLFGVRLCAFFSGSETGFYRLSIPRLSIDARAGDKQASQLLWFANHPAYFVATSLIGTNVANDVCTAAVSWGVVLLFGTPSASLEVFATLLTAPIIFEFGELLPKSIYYLIPLQRLRSVIGWFRIFFFLFLPLSWPLVMATRFFERLRGQTSEVSELVMGRNRLVQLMRHGHREGVLTDLQSRLANGLLQLAPQPVLLSVIPNARVLGVSEAASREQMVDFAGKYGLSSVAVHRTDDETAWYGYVFVAELQLEKAEKPKIHPMPLVPCQTGKLEALHLLQTADASYGAVIQQSQTIGIVARNGLVEQVFRPPVAAPAARAK
jgi:CBS domain containing-hemolysin-like protein